MTAAPKFNPTEEYNFDDKLDHTKQILEDALVALGEDNEYTPAEIAATRKELNEDPNLLQQIDAEAAASVIRDKTAVTLAEDLNVISLKGQPDLSQEQGEKLRPILTELLLLTQGAIISRTRAKIAVLKKNGGPAANDTTLEAENNENEDNSLLKARALKHINKHGPVTVDDFIEVVKNVHGDEIEPDRVEKILNELVDQTVLIKEGEVWKFASTTEEESSSDEESETEADSETESEPEGTSDAEEEDGGAPEMNEEEDSDEDEESEAETDTADSESGDEEGAWEETEEERQANEREQREEAMQEFIEYITDGKRGPVALAIIKTIRQHPSTDFEELKVFMENPDILTAKKRGELEAELKKLNEQKDQIKFDLDQKIAEMQALKGSKGDVLIKVIDQKTALSNELRSINTKLSEKNKELGALPKASNEAGDREQTSLEATLVMLNYYYAQKEGGTKNYKKILEESQKAIRKEEVAEANQSIWGSGFFEKVGSLFRPTLTSTLAVIHTKDDELAELDKVHFMELKDVADSHRGMQRWIKKMKTANGEKIETAEKMEKYIPKIIAHLEISLYEGGSAKINPLSIDYTRSLLGQLRKAVRQHSLDKAKKTSGNTLDKLDAYFESLNSIHENKNEVSKDIVFGHATSQKVKAGLMGGLGTAVGGSATYVGSLLGPYLAGGVAGGALGAYLFGKSFFVKDDQAKYQYRKWGFRSAVLPALMLGATGPLGISSYAALGAIGAAGAFVPNLIKHRKTIGRFFFGGDKAPESAANDSSYSKAESNTAKAA